MGFCEWNCKALKNIYIVAGGTSTLWSLPLPVLQVSVSINKDIGQKKEAHSSPLSEISAKKTLIHSQALHVHSLWVQRRPLTSTRTAFKEGDGSAPAEKSFRVSAEIFSQASWLSPAELPTCHKPIRCCRGGECPWLLRQCLDTPQTGVAKWRRQ